MIFTLWGLSVHISVHKSFQLHCERHSSEKMLAQGKNRIARSL